VKESDIQEQICDYLDEKKKTYLFRYFHVPNGGKHKVWYLHKLVRMGMKSGVPDLVLEFPDGKMVYLEIKTDKGRLSEKQIIWQKVSKVLNTPHYVIKGSVDANMDVLEGVFALFPDARIKQ